MESESERIDAMSTSRINYNQHNASQSISENSSLSQDFESLYGNDLQYDYDGIGEYFFESARLAYKADPDYKNLVQAIVIMEAGRHQAQKDLKNLSSHRKRAAASPLDFVEQIESKENLGISKVKKTGFIPNIDWDKYGLSRNVNFSKDPLNSNSTAADETGLEKTRSTFSQSWTQAEQSRLEDLLLVYPPEEIESRRWEKIAVALGTRTPSQVASRVQKYFLKLLRAGVPIPGRQPNPKNLAKNSRHETIVQNGKASTQNNNGKDDETKMKDADDSSSEEISDLEEINPDLKNTSEYKELQLIKKVLRKKMNSAKLYKDT